MNDKTTIRAELPHHSVVKPTPKDHRQAAPLPERKSNAAMIGVAVFALILVVAWLLRRG